jgi:hypothetical protein
MSLKVPVCLVAGLLIVYAPVRAAHLVHHAIASFGMFLDTLHVLH